MTHYSHKNINFPKALTKQQKNILIGLLLGDCWLQTQSKNNVIEKRNYRVRFEQGDVHREYIEELYTIFKPWIPSPPKRTKRLCLETGNFHVTWRMQSYTHSVFSPLVSIFYPEGSSKKRISEFFVDKYLQPESLAYWFMDDGGKSFYGKGIRYGLHLHTQGFQTYEVDYLAAGLKRVYDLECWTRVNKSGRMIVISGKSYKQFLSICGKFIHPSMYGKLPCKGLLLSKDVF